MKQMYVKHTRASTADFNEEVCQLRKSYEGWSGYIDFDDALLKRRQKESVIVL